jgi:hypothetical protein
VAGGDPVDDPLLQRVRLVEPGPRALPSAGARPGARAAGPRGASVRPARSSSMRLSDGRREPPDSSPGRGGHTGEVPVAFPVGVLRPGKSTAHRREGRLRSDDTEASSGVASGAKWPDQLQGCRTWFSSEPLSPAAGDRGPRRLAHLPAADQGLDPGIRGDLGGQKAHTVPEAPIEATNHGERPNDPQAWRQRNIKPLPGRSTQANPDLA